MMVRYGRSTRFNDSYVREPKGSVGSFDISSRMRLVA
jgi:hypothetical protein